MKLLLDTSAYVRFKQNMTEVVEYIANARIVFFSSVVLGELMFGFRNGTKFDKNMAELREFLSRDVVEPVPVGEVTADRYARIAAGLKKQGEPIPTNDIWLAAQTMELGAELVTSDRHFEKVNGLVFKMFD